MNSKEYNDLVEKYLAAESTLEEEEKLFNAENQRPDIAKWSTYVKRKRYKAPSNLNESIWEGIQTRKRSKHRYLIAVSSLAATIALFFAVFIYNTFNGYSEYAEKEALLNEALSMYSVEEPKEQKQTILYEDDLVIIYVAAREK